MRKIKVGVVGVGYLGRRHAQIYKELNCAELVGICDIDKNKLEEVSKTLGIEGFLSYKELFSKVEAVSVAVPSFLHYKISKDFLLHNIHVLVEKPFVLNLKEADDLINLSRKNKLILQVGHIERFNSAFSSTLKLIKDVRFIESHRLTTFTGRSTDIGVVMDLMIHDIDIVLGLVKSKIKSIEAIGVNVLTELEDIANARIHFKNGCICNLTASRISDESVRKIRIFQKDAYICLDYKNEEAYLYKKKDSSIIKKSLPIEKEEPLKKELKSFLDCVIYKKEPVVSGEVAREALEVALQIQKKIWLKKRF
ncbi:MAG: Gfo/Idh/MocA family oxidoreductase [Candidatus Omnitrophica bacterium]|nr:Gfo/Idh/MocA family oxidoreductase [Candidatus Omnitrophota bacterium]